FIAVIPAVLGPVIHTLQRLLSPWTKMAGGFAAGLLLARPTRTGLTVGVLVVAISTGVGLGNAIINNVDDVRSWFRRMTAGDIMLVGPSAAQGAVERRDATNIRQTVAAQPGVDYVVESRHFPARASGVPFFVVGLGTDIDEAYLRQLAQLTGARFYQAPSPDSLGQLFYSIATLLRTQYVLVLDGIDHHAIRARAPPLSRKS
ncbi:MAG: hypothetical protein IID33_15780, partial [Planctomycetes bacterium]|nr:hypothetical protein [Planctomycetota bacterium]